MWAYKVFEGCGLLIVPCLVHMGEWAALILLVYAIVFMMAIGWAKTRAKRLNHIRESALLPIKDWPVMSFREFKEAYRVRVEAGMPLNVHEATAYMDRTDAKNQRSAMEVLRFVDVIMTMPETEDKELQSHNTHELTLNPLPAELLVD